jgi:GcrA cell cycle regulator
MWTDERVEAVTKLWNEGFSASEIARRIGNATRNSVIGKVTRLGLPGRKVKVRRPANDRWNTEDRRMERGDKPYKQAVKAIKTNWRAEPLPATPVTDVARVAFADLEPDHCRWPVGDPKHASFGYCGCKKVEGLPYCNAHARRAYTAPEAKQKPLYGHVNIVIRSEAAKHLNAKEFADS